MHLLQQVVLRLLNLVLTLLLSQLTLRTLNVRLQGPSLHIRAVRAILSLFDVAFSINLSVKNLFDLLVVLSGLDAFVDVVEACLLVLLDALLDVFSFLSLLKFFVFVVYHVCHLVHQCLDARASLSHGSLSLSLLLVL